MSSLRSRIKKKMQENNISAHALEKRAGLKSSAVHNILYGRSKNPSINLIQSIAETLNCSLSDLVGDELNIPSQENTFHVSSATPSADKHITWDKNLYIDCLEAVCHLLKSHNFALTKQKIFDYVDEIYLYSLKSGNGKVDKFFADWIIKKNSK